MKLVRFRYCLPLFTKIIIKVGKPINPPESASKEELKKVTNYLMNDINNLIG